jgi:hypothetical protein
MRLKLKLRGEKKELTPRFETGRSNCVFFVIPHLRKGDNHQKKPQGNVVDENQYHG